MDDKTRVGVQTPDLKITQGVLFGRQEYEKIYCRKFIGNPSMKMRGKSGIWQMLDKKQIISFPEL